MAHYLDRRNVKLLLLLIINSYYPREPLRSVRASSRPPSLCTKMNLSQRLVFPSMKRDAMRSSGHHRPSAGYFNYAPKNLSISMIQAFQTPQTGPNTLNPSRYLHF